MTLEKIILIALGVVIIVVGALFIGGYPIFMPSTDRDDSSPTTAVLDPISENADEPLNTDYMNVVNDIRRDGWDADLWEEYAWTAARVEEFNEFLMGEWIAFCPEEPLGLIGCTEREVRTLFAEEGHVTLRIEDDTQDVGYSELRYRWLVDHAGDDGGAGYMGQFDLADPVGSGGIEYVFLVNAGRLIYFQVDLLLAPQRPSLLIFERVPADESLIPSDNPSTPGASVGEGEEN